MIFNYIVTNEDNNKIIMYILLKKFNFSRKLIVKLKSLSDGIMLNGERIFTNALVKEGDLVTANVLFDEESLNVFPENIPIEILYEDKTLIAVNKPAGMVIHPTHNYRCGTLSNALAYYYANNGIHSKIRPVSRLDRGTSGIVLFAKNQFVQERLTGKSSDIFFTKKYIALINGIFDSPEGIIDMPIARVPGSTIERYTDQSGCKAVTHYRTLKKYFSKVTKNTFSLTEFTLETGRTHQIRVHCKYSGHPIAGDTLYFLEKYKDNLGLERQALHSYKTAFTHPVTLKNIEIFSKFPPDIVKALNILEPNQ